MSRAEKYSAARSLLRQRQGHGAAYLGAVQVDHRQAEVVRRHRLVGVQQEVADVAVAVIDPGAVHAADHLRHFGDQRALEARLPAAAGPSSRVQLLEVGGRRQLLGDDEGVLRRRIAAALAIGHRGHGRHAGLGQALDRPSTPGRRRAPAALAREQVLDDLAPADAAVDLDEVAAPVDLGAQGAAPFQLAVDLALQGLHVGEGILVRPIGS